MLRRWGATSEYRLKIDVFAPIWSVWPKILGKRGRLHQPFFLLEWMIFRWYKNVGTSFFRFVTIHAFDRQTDRRTGGQKGLGNDVRCITCSLTVKKNKTPTNYPQFPPEFQKFPGIPAENSAHKNSSVALIAGCKPNFEILNPVGMWLTSWTDRPRIGQTDLLIAYAAIHYVARQQAWTLSVSFFFGQWSSSPGIVAVFLQLFCL